METVRVGLGERTYVIHIGAGALDAAALFAPHVAARRVAVVTNEIVAPLYLARLEASLTHAGGRAAAIVLPDGEDTKSWSTLERVFDWLLAGQFGRDGVVVALGGGVIGDLAGFAAAVYQRGVAFVQVPTTLLAQVDSSVGGKTGINHPRGKNMIGAFHQPRAVIADVGALDTLPERELRAGVAEVIKHAFALDADFVRWLEASLERVLARERGAVAYAVRRSCELKAEIVARDERESGPRALLNFGHTFGHAIEAALGYGVWLHGEAVAAGMAMAAELSVRLGMLSAAERERLRRLLERAGLPCTVPAIGPERLLAPMRADKKVRQGALRFVLLRAAGSAVIRDDVDHALLVATIEASRSAPAR